MRPLRPRRPYVRISYGLQHGITAHTLGSAHVIKPAGGIAKEQTA